MPEIAGPPQGILSADLSILESFLNANRHLVYVDVIIFTLLAMNIISTFSSEIEYIWKAKRSATTIAFFFIRYAPPIFVGLSMVGSVSYETKYLGDACQLLKWTETVCTIAVWTLAETLMVMRVWALYRFDKRMLAFLGFVILSQTSVGSWAAVTIVSSSHPIPWPRQAMPIPGCPLDVPDASYQLKIVFAYNMASVGIICMCMLNQCLARNSIEYSYLGTWRDIFGIRTAWPIIHILIRDGCLYFLIVFCTNMILLIVLSVSERVAFFTLTLAQGVHSIPATRLLLNLRQRSHSKLMQHGRRPEDIALERVSTIDFAPRSSWEEPGD